MIDVMADPARVGNPWDQQPHESARAYAAFEHYRSAGPERALRSTSRATGVPLSTVNHWSAKWHWVTRTAAWDADLADKAHAAEADELVEMRRQHIKMAKAFQTNVVRRLQTIDPETLSPVHLAAWFKLSVDVERQARGEADSRVDVEHSGTIGTEHDDGKLVREILADPVATELALAALDRVAGRREAPEESGTPENEAEVP